MRAPSAARFMTPATAAMASGRPSRACSGRAAGSAPGRSSFLTVFPSTTSSGMDSTSGLGGRGLLVLGGGVGALDGALASAFLAAARASSQLRAGGPPASRTSRIWASTGRSTRAGSVAARASPPNTPSSGIARAKT